MLVLAAGNEGHHQRRAHVGPGQLALLVHGGVGHVDGVPQPAVDFRLQCCVVHFERQQRGDGVLRERRDRQPAGHIARGMAAHAVGDHVEPDRRAHRAVHAAQFQRQQAVFV
jgi:hypothetical protein